MSACDITYMQQFNSDVQFEEFDKAHPDEAFKKRSFTEFQQHDFRTRLLMHSNCLAEKLKQANLDLNRIQGKSMLENKKLSNRKILYQFLRRIPIQNRTIAYDIVNRDSNEKQD